MSKEALWILVTEQTEIYGAYTEDEIDWGEDVGSEIID